MTSQEFTTLARILEQIATHHDQDARKCPGPSNCPLASAINDLGILLANTTKIESGFDDPTKPEASQGLQSSISARMDRATAAICGEASYGPEMRVEDLPPAATEPQASPETLAAISVARDADQNLRCPWIAPGFGRCTLPAGHEGSHEVASCAEINKERGVDSDTAHAILRAQGRLP